MSKDAKRAGKYDGLPPNSPCRGCTSCLGTSDVHEGVNMLVHCANQRGLVYVPQECANAAYPPALVPDVQSVVA